jgi:uncharacterized protein (TIGR03067 family)
MHIVLAGVRLQAAIEDRLKSGLQRAASYHENLAFWGRIAYIGVQPFPRLLVPLGTPIMVRTFALVACFAIFSIPLSPAVAEDESEQDLKKMAGDWVPVLMHLNGKKQPDKVTKAIKLTISGEQYNTVVGDEKDEGTLKLDATKEPREMNIITNLGENKGKPIPCIYELKVNELRICYGLNGTARPADFKAGEDGAGVVMRITYKRAPKIKR